MKTRRSDSPLFTNRSLFIFCAVAAALLPASPYAGAKGTKSEGDTAELSSEEIIWNYLYERIGNPYGTAGLMGNLYAESTLHSNNLQNSYERKLGMTDDEYTGAVDSGAYDNFVRDAAGYGLAHLNLHFFFGALYLFVINSVFIALATYFMVKYLHFPTVSGISGEVATRRRRLISTVLVIILVPSIWSAFTLIQNNNFERNVQNFVENNRLIAPRTYIYDYSVQGRQAQIALAGEPLDEGLRAGIYTKAASYGIKQKDLTLLEHSFGMSQRDMNTLIEEIYNNTNAERDANQAMLESMQMRLEELSQEITRLKEEQARQPEADPGGLGD